MYKQQKICIDKKFLQVVLFFILSSTFLIILSALLQNTNLNISKKAAEIPPQISSIQMKGEILEDRIIQNPSQLGGIQNKMDPKQKIVYETIPVMFGVSKQVIVNHCDEYINKNSERYTDWTSPEIKPCKFIEKMIQRDFQQLQNDFKDTGKTFVFAGIDKTWDQTVDQKLDCNHNKAGGSQYVPYNDCFHSDKSIYVTILYAKNAKNSGGEALPWRHTIRYVAPGKFIDGKDHWELQDFHWQPTYVLTHEIGHLFGQYHVPWIFMDSNEVVPISYPLFYQGDLDHDTFGYNKSLVMTITQRGSLKKNSEIIAESIPNTVEIMFSGLQSGPYTVKQYKVSPSGWGISKIEKENFTESNYHESSAILPLTRTEIYQSPLLFFEITQNNKKNYYWFSIMDAHFLFWENQTEIAQKILLPIKTSDNAIHIIPNSNLKYRTVELLFTQKTSEDVYYLVDRWHLDGIPDSTLININTNVPDSVFIFLRTYVGHTTLSNWISAKPQGDVLNYGTVKNCTGLIQKGKYNQDMCEFTKTGNTTFEIDY
ncbi:hypothetical protein A2334_00640 [Candidatus Roizmanbacteria bacterium RIFOXYB2_FULL_38_10]|uniref:Uncharacterized protein n=1 Tax=Candidatus Roizmanbacteria bacterium RIFOXYD1_FULL_38_12 TaxID=1802093 RepID=A0A1F7L1F1_9BACT|nr:MAG: hypothetical protein A3K47_03910 [Candidatus Roizmanbacteria bacterium RIFOXYA2_FULL_38_14]OGK63903.1 MAG: hypothetical protein A3K27_03910 [Candidatus Roizmanbacteria bacterium RIFOXYA1_FULL_37_12]OGK65749.1 MAG: hypothetical protein A3K38_03910 [Candidatus Roizmanbacteria bacterium RIFOXYB1_FULL_40_23]OGK68194.1 MAG: hypothetical protein A2334_00640 [Candidatus Roizmanbacteria bacterium RIFOXYB2_FULL_38_10]OGK70154.1 MAG: hypothetical protein A3K21_03915 [Candidatus Roizmanbacteria ba